MSPKRRLMVAAVTLVTAVIGFAVGRTAFRPGKPVSQPIAFSHQKHTQELEIECALCHEYYETAEHSGLPLLETCLGCHEEPQTEMPEEQRIRDLAEAGENDVFRKLFSMPDNVFYSHRRHVAIADIPCETCHGDIANSIAPPRRPLVRVDMDFCMECHEQHEVSQDCTRCHH